MKPSRLALASAPLLAVALAACGTASTSGAQPSETATARSAAAASGAARFAAAADRICAVQNQRENALGNGLVNADVVSVAHLPKAAAYLEKVVAIRLSGMSAMRQLAAAGSAAEHAEQQAFVRAFLTVVTDYQNAAEAARTGDMAAFRADFGRVAPHGYPTGPDARAFDRASAPFPFRACGMSNGI
jgi:hypothetical protein